IYCLARDYDGQIWVGTRTGLVLLDGSSGREIETKLKLSGQRIWSLFVDREGTLWVAADNAILYLKRGAQVFEDTHIRDGGVPRIDEDAGGRLWMAEYDRPIRQMPLPDQRSPKTAPEIRIRDIKLLGFDHDGSMWM